MKAAETWRGTDALGKDPELAAALLTMGLVDSRDLPLLAAHWMAAGNDGVLLVEMACLTRETSVRSRIAGPVLDWFEDGGHYLWARVLAR